METQFRHETCAICHPKRISRALCNCCQQYLCRDHLKEHDDFLHNQLEALVDQLNCVYDKFEEINIENLVHPYCQRLDQWRHQAIRSIEQIYEDKCQQVNEYFRESRQNLCDQTKVTQHQITEVLRQQDATKEQIEHFTNKINQLDKQTKQLREEHFIEIDIKPIEIDENSVQLIVRNEIQSKRTFLLGEAIHSIALPSEKCHLISSNQHQILIYQDDHLYFYDYNLNNLSNIDCSTQKSVRDLCWSTTRNQFLLLTDENVFTIHENLLTISEFSVKPRTNGHLHKLTCSNDNLFLTAFKWGTHIYRYDLCSPTVELIQRFQLPVNSPKDETIQQICHDNDHHLAFIVFNRMTNEKRFELRCESTLTCVWVVQLGQHLITSSQTYFCSIQEKHWLIVHCEQSKIVHIDDKGSIKDLVQYELAQPQCLQQIRQDLIIVTTQQSLNLHEFLSLDQSSKQSNSVDFHQ